MIRAVILAATFATLFCMWMDKPAPVTVNSVPYCRLQSGNHAPCAGLKYKLNI